MSASLTYENAHKIRTGRCRILSNTSLHLTCSIVVLVACQSYQRQDPTVSPLPERAQSACSPSALQGVGVVNRCSTVRIGLYCYLSRLMSSSRSFITPSRIWKHSRPLRCLSTSLSISVSFQKLYNTFANLKAPVAPEMSNRISRNQRQPLGTSYRPRHHNVPTTTEMSARTSLNQCQLSGASYRIRHSGCTHSHGDAAPMALAPFQPVGDSTALRTAPLLLSYDHQESTMKCIACHEIMGLTQTSTPQEYLSGTAYVASLQARRPHRP